MNMKQQIFAVSMPYEKDLFLQYKNLSQSKWQHFILESGRGGRYSMAGLEPVAVLRGKGEELRIQEGGQESVLKGNPLDLVKNYMAERYVKHDDSLPPFQGGAMGYFSYDCIRYIERLDDKAQDDLELPDVFLMIYDEVIVFDHKERVLWVIVRHHDEKQATERLQYLQHIWTQQVDSVAIPLQNTREFTPYVSFTEEEFVKAVERIQEYIASGDVFQVNLSVRQSQPLRSHPIEIYEKLREINPSPYMGYMELGDFQIVSGSPELLIKKAGMEVSTRPIAGTRSRGKDAQEDEVLAKELIENEKERAEHVMLVDLERNDLGRVCRYGTVEVNEFMAIEKYSHVMHIVSNVRGELEEGKDAFDILKAVFPGGTITGAPKIRTMEIIEELEPVRRGIYTGSIGWLSFSGEMELNIVIRTLLAKGGYAHVQAGAGIVIDSNPQNEYKESLKKAVALWRAKEASEQVGE